MSKEERNAEIEAAYARGTSLRSLGVRYRLSYERIRQVLRARGVDLRSSPARKLDGAVKSLTMQCFPASKS